MSQSDYDLVKATGVAEVHDDFISKLSRIVPLTGMYPRLCHRASLTCKASPTPCMLKRT